MSFINKWRTTNRMTAGLTRIERARGFLEVAWLSEALQGFFPGTPEGRFSETCSRWFRCEY